MKAPAEIINPVESQCEGKTAYTAPKPQRSETERRAAMNAIWKGAKAVIHGDPVEKYLFRRCGLTAFPKDLRFLPDGRHYTGPS